MRSNSEWPPPFTLRYSTRARSVRLRICARRGLQLIVPRFFDAAKTPIILQQHKNWIERTWQRIQHSLTRVEPEEVSPQQLSLPALNETWTIHYIPVSQSKALWRELPEEKNLTVYACNTHSRKIKKILLSWLQQRAQHYLLTWLTKLGQQTGLYYSRAGVRNATTRWGSCSANKTISLNYKLLFLPNSLVEYVLLHELCHTVHFNHSPQFWELVKKFSPEYQQWRKQLKQANDKIPIWVEDK